MTIDSLISMNNVTLAYDRHPAIHHVSGDFVRGSLTAVIGPNGSGKSTLVKTIVGLIRPVEGRLQIHGINHRDIAYLPQVTNIDDSFPISVEDVVLFGLWRRTGAFCKITRSMCEEASQSLYTVGLEGFEKRAFSSMSAGQRQRVLFARVLVVDSQLILLDEPFNSIDSRTINDLIQLIEHWHYEGRTVIAVLHDYDQVRKYFPESLLLARELIAWGVTKNVLTSANLSRARAMSEAWSDDNLDVCHVGI
ncbi:MAG: ABC transporter ATP-binding protein [Rhodospirillaceae bacterium]|nr:ABC transporter ATP-binding protein [Rhodospirillaceae bacterium]